MTKVFIIFFSLIFSFNLFAKNINTGSYEIPIMVKNSNEGVFVKLAKEVAKKAGHEITVNVYPPKRTVQMLLEGQIDMLFPGLDVLFTDQLDKIKPASESIYVKNDYAFIKKGNKTINSIADLKGKTIGLTLGYPYVNEITQDKSLKIEWANSDVINMSKLAQSRIDVFIVEKETGLGAKSEAKVDEQVVISGKAISQQNVYFAFSNNEKGKKLEKDMSAALVTMKKDGSFGVIMSEVEKIKSELKK